MQKQLRSILEEARNQLQNADSLENTEEIRVKLLGKKGQLTEILRSMGSLGAEERKEIGKLANEVRGQVESMLEPGKIPVTGVKHPITKTIDDMTKIFMNMGFELTEGPEVETVFMNFDALNAGPNHPSRDMTDTFYITENTLRTRRT